MKSRQAVHDRRIANDQSRRYAITKVDGEPLAIVNGIHAVWEYAEDFGLEAYHYVAL